MREHREVAEDWTQRGRARAVVRVAHAGGAVWRRTTLEVFAVHISGDTTWCTRRARRVDVTGAPPTNCGQRPPSAQRERELPVTYLAD